MAIKRTLLCIVLVSSVLVLSEALPANQNLYHRLQKRSGMRLCGRMLVEALAAVCQSEYYGPSHIKKSNAYDSDFYRKWDDNVNPEGVLEPRSALDFFSMNQLTRRGVADECCTKSCSLNQLVSYCGSMSPGK